MKNRQTNRRDRGRWLWMSAGVLAGLIVVQGSGVMDSSAQAEMTSTSGAYTVMTTDGGNEELLFVVDSGQEALLVYKTDRNQGTQLLDREDLAGLFSRARARAFGTP